MSYTPNPLDPSLPTDADPAAAAAAELRALKARINGLPISQAAYLIIPGEPVRPITVGANNSAGAGFRQLRVANI